MTEEQFLSIFKTSRDFIHDFNNFLECNRIIQNYDRINARRFLSDMTNEYQNEINLFGLLFDGVHTITFAYFSDYEIQAQLKYLCIHIPVYSLIKKGEPDLAKMDYGDVKIVSFPGWFRIYSTYHPLINLKK